MTYKTGLAVLNSTVGGRKYEITPIKLLAQGLAHVTCLADKRHHPSQPRLVSVSLRKIIFWSRNSRSLKQIWFSDKLCKADRMLWLLGLGRVSAGWTCSPGDQVSWAMLFWCSWVTGHLRILLMALG